MNAHSAPDPTIRQADASDAARLSLIASATFLETFAGMIDGRALIAHCETKLASHYLARLLEGGARAWLAELDGAPVGYALLTEPELDAATAGDIELKKIYVLSRFHGSGLARRLLDAALAASEGCKRMLLGVKVDNLRAVAFYHKQGFKQIGTRQFEVGGKYYDDIVFARAIHRN